eukprot:CAMPEP_0117526368 /NCGR_PEP_ID=MMETSP0784-20121206/36249_1 /TAXON_ID=39447 /ORGANISM="" /LENGTH=132 /DNA_ID=CAMNT_0005322593 /DNA_START=390 /DNA_END=788 /DNA_ORIENTATION=+
MLTQREPVGPDEIDLIPGDRLHGEHALVCHAALACAPEVLLGKFHAVAHVDACTHRVRRGPAQQKRRHHHATTKTQIQKLASASEARLQPFKGAHLDSSDDHGRLRGVLLWRQFAALLLQSGGEGPRLYRLD